MLPGQKPCPVSVYSLIKTHMILGTILPQLAYKIIMVLALRRFRPILDPSLTNKKSALFAFV